MGDLSWLDGQMRNFRPEALQTLPFRSAIHAYGGCWAVDGDGHHYLAVRTDEQLAPGVHTPKLTEFVTASSASVIELPLAELQAWAPRVEPEPQWKECRSCEGTGWIRCKDCRGRGVVTHTCSECDDEHEARCERCTGVPQKDGRMQCDDCEGAGKTLQEVKPDVGFVGGVAIDRRLLADLLHHPLAVDETVTVQIPPTPEDRFGLWDPIRVVGTGWIGVLMPVRLSPGEHENAPTFAAGGAA